MNGTKRKLRDVPPLVFSPHLDPMIPLDYRRYTEDDEEEERLMRLKELERIRDLIRVKDEQRNFTIMDAYAAHVEGARRNAGAEKLFQHAFLQFPTDLKVTPTTEIEMLAQGAAFINRTYGGNAVFHARLDRDEAGLHGVDVFFAPRYQKTTAKGTEDWISLSKFSKELARDRFGQRQKAVKNPKTQKFDPVFDKAGNPVMVWNDSGYFQGRALQDAFFEHLRDSMGLDWAERGQRKKTRDHDRLEPEEYAIEAEKRKVAAEIARQMKPHDPSTPQITPAAAPERPYEAIVGALVADTRQKAEKAAQRAGERAVEAERRLVDARARAEALDTALRQKASDLDKIETAVAQKKTNIETLMAKKTALEARLRALRAA